MSALETMGSANQNTPSCVDSPATLSTVRRFLPGSKPAARAASTLVQVGSILEQGKRGNDPEGDYRTRPDRGG